MEVQLLSSDLTKVCATVEVRDLPHNPMVIEWADHNDQKRRYFVRQFGFGPNTTGYVEAKFTAVK